MISITKTGLTETEHFYEGSSVSFAGLPSTYTRLDYLEGTGTQQIDCGFKFNPETDSYRVKFQTVTYGNGMVFASTGSPYYWLYDYGSVNRIYTTASGTQIYLTNGSTDYNVHECYYHKKSSYYDGILKGTFSESLNSTTANNMYLFSYGGSWYLQGRIFYLEVYSNNILTHHLIPAKNSSDVLGMYDLCTGTFLTNSGTGTFVAGPTITTLNSQIISNDFMEI